MYFSSNRIRFHYLLTFTPRHVALALGCVGNDPVLWRWTSRFCGSGPNGCTLGASDARELVRAVERLLHRHRAACADGIERAIGTSLEALFWVFFDAIERSVDMRGKDCVCTWRQRVRDAEELAPFLVDVARVYWSTGAPRDWMFKELERLACRASEVSECDGSSARCASDDPSVKVRAGRLAMLLVDVANVLCCDNRGNAGWT
jgi:hypothetical protein